MPLNVTDDAPYWAQLRQLSQSMLRMVNSPDQLEPTKILAAAWNEHVDRIATELESEWRMARRPEASWWAKLRRNHE